MEQWRKDLYTNYLSHHGILGQKWGQLNGPPYPLSASSHSASEKKAGWERSVTKREGAGVAVAAVAVMYAPEIAIIGGTIAHDAVVKSKINHEKKVREKAEKDKNGLPLKSKQTSEQDDVKAVNRESKLIYGKDQLVSTKNCVHCSVAYEMRRRGYDVIASKSVSGQTDSYIKGIFPSLKYKSSTDLKMLDKDPDGEEKKAKALLGNNKDVSQKAIRDLRSEPSNSRGIVLVRWGSGVGHAMNYKVDPEGNVSLLDAQIGKIYNEKASEKLLRNCCTVEYARTDNVKFNASQVKRSVKGW